MPAAMRWVARIAIKSAEQPRIGDHRHTLRLARL
jgi:hypothetical protein